MPEQQYFTDKKIIIYSLVLVGILGAYSVYDVWGHNYHGIKDFVVDFKMIGIPLIIMMLRVITAVQIKVLGPFTLVVLFTISAIIMFTVIGRGPRLAVWTYGIASTISMLGAVVTLFMGWDEN